MLTKIAEQIEKRGEKRGEMRGEKRGEKRGEMRGEMRGEEKQKREIASIMKNNGEPVEKIHRYTGLSLQEIEKL